MCLQQCTAVEHSHSQRMNERGLHGQLTRPLVLLVALTTSIQYSSIHIALNNICFLYKSYYSRPQSCLLVGRNILHIYNLPTLHHHKS